MANYKVTDTELISIANAIRAKGNTESPLSFPTGFVSAVQNISGNSGGNVNVLSGIHGDVYTGASNPTASQGEEGDVYLKLSDHNTDYAIVVEAYMKHLNVWTAFEDLHMPYSGLTAAPFSSATIEQITTLLAAAHTGAIDLKEFTGWNIGDVRSIPISSFTNNDGRTLSAGNFDIVISSFDEYMNCGNVMQFDFKDTLPTGFPIFSTNSNSGGYGVSQVYLETLPNLVNALPSWLKDSLITFNVLAETESGGTIGTVQNNKLALRSLKEIFGTGPEEGLQLPYYRDSIYDGLTKYNGHGGSAFSWWTRTLEGTSNVVFIQPGMGARGYGANSDYPRLAPFGCL